MRLRPGDLVVEPGDGRLSLAGDAQRLERLGRDRGQCVGEVAARLVADPRQPGTFGALDEHGLDLDAGRVGQDRRVEQRIVAFRYLELQGRETARQLVEAASTDTAGADELSRAHRIGKPQPSELDRGAEHPADRRRIARVRRVHELGGEVVCRTSWICGARPGPHDAAATTNPSNANLMYDELTASHPRL